MSDPDSGSAALQRFPIRQRRDGSVFEIGPVARKSSPLDVPGVPLGITQDDILTALHESRERLVE